MSEKQESEQPYGLPSFVLETVHKDAVKRGFTESQAAAIANHAAECTEYMRFPMALRAAKEHKFDLAALVPASREALRFIEEGGRREDLTLDMVCAILRVRKSGKDGGMR